MSHIAFDWQASPPPEADVYTTRRGESRYTTHRYWDGARWWQIEWGRTRSQTAFKWPKGSRTQFPPGMARCRDEMTLRRINDPFQGGIQWGIPYRVYDEKETLAYLVRVGHLPADWRTAYQHEMRVRDQRGDTA